ncbi:DUF4352 domain-containing protein [Paenibacillus chitinolyticus]|uniref:DUF4352 domain-containing protein n=1 Tax=Paenibacillus chitinolyticus TaxID=79263 RepID=UPI00366E2754
MKIKLGLLAAVSCLALTACGDYKQQASPLKQGGAADRSSAAKAPRFAASLAQEYSKEDTVQIGDAKIKVSKVEKFTEQGPETPNLPDGEFVVVTLDIENSGAQELAYNPYSFEMANSRGMTSDKVLASFSGETGLKYGELAPGAKVSGTLVFEQPKGDPKLQLLHKEDTGPDKAVKINLQ